MIITAPHNQHCLNFAYSDRENSSRRGDGMSITLQINIALWGMLVCAQIKLAQLLS
jgi:hypothetical protein